MKKENIEKRLISEKIRKQGRKVISVKLLQTTKYNNRNFHRPITKMFTDEKK